jgi:hypothetical protein
LEKLVKWLRSGFKVMNSVLGSLKAIPGIEIAKEFKNHLESAYEVIEVGKPDFEAANNKMLHNSPYVIAA